MAKREITLWLIQDGDVEWLHDWARAYPCVVHQSIGDVFDEAWQDIGNDDVAVVVHGAAVPLWLNHWARCDVLQRQRVRAVLLVSPEMNNEKPALCFACPTAWVATNATQQRDWQEYARFWPSRLFTQSIDKQWQWGMTLLAEMLDR